MSMSANALEISGLSVSYGKSEVLHGVDMQVTEGNVYGLIGLNGEGKTTLIKTLTGLRTPDSGSISIFGLKRDDSALPYKMAYLPERFNPPPFLTGLEFLNFAASLYKDGFDKNKALEGADCLSLDRNVLSERIGTYSKGMRQKLGLIAVVTSPAKLIILDEPLSGLDPQARSHVKDVISGLKAREKTILICSHILSDLGVLCDRISVLSKGEIIFVGTPDDLKKQGKTDDLEKAFLYIIAKTDRDERSQA